MPASLSQRSAPALPRNGPRGLLRGRTGRSGGSWPSRGRVGVHGRVWPGPVCRCYAGSRLRCVSRVWPPVVTHCCSLHLGNQCLAHGRGVSLALYSLTRLSSPHFGVHAAVALAATMLWRTAVQSPGAEYEEASVEPSAAAPPPAPSGTVIQQRVDRDGVAPSTRWRGPATAVLVAVVALMSAAAAPAALQRAVGTLLAAALGVSTSVALVAAALAAAAGLLSSAVATFRTVLIPAPTPILDLPPLWVPPSSPGSVSRAEDGQGSTSNAEDSALLPRFNPPTTPSALDEMRQRARQQYFANKNWRETLPRPAAAGARREQGPGGNADARQLGPAPAGDFDTRQAARAAWAQRVKRAQGAKLPASDAPRGDSSL